MFPVLWRYAEPAYWTKALLLTSVQVPSGTVDSTATVQEWFASGMSGDCDSSSSNFGCTSVTTCSTSFWGILQLYSVSVVFFLLPCIKLWGVDFYLRLYCCCIVWCCDNLRWKTLLIVYLSTISSGSEQFWLKVYYSE